MAWTEYWVRHDAAGGASGANNTTDGTTGALTLLEAIDVLITVPTKFKVVASGTYDEFTANDTTRAGTYETPAWYCGYDSDGNEIDPVRTAIGTDDKLNGPLDSTDFPHIHSNYRITPGSWNFFDRIYFQVADYVGFYMSNNDMGMMNCNLELDRGAASSVLPTAADDQILLNCDFEKTDTTNNVVSVGGSGVMMIDNRIKIATSGTCTGVFLNASRCHFLDNVFIGVGTSGHVCLDGNNQQSCTHVGNTFENWDTVTSSQNGINTALPTFVDNIVWNVNEFYYNEYSATQDHAIVMAGNIIDSTISDSNVEIVACGKELTISADPFEDLTNENYNIDDSETAIGAGILTYRDVGANQREATVSSYDESVGSSADGVASATDTQDYVESDGSAAAGVADATDTQIYVESVGVEAAGEASATDVHTGMTESVGAEATGATDATDTASYVEAIGSEADGVAGASDLITGMTESVGSEATAEAGATDVHTGMSETVGAEATGEAYATDTVGAQELIGAEAAGVAGATDEHTGMSEAVGSVADGEAGAADIQIYVESIGAEADGQADATDKLGGSESVYAEAQAEAGATDWQTHIEAVGVEATGEAGAGDLAIRYDTVGALADGIAVATDWQTNFETVGAEATGETGVYDTIGTPLVSIAAVYIMLRKKQN